MNKNFNLFSKYIKGKWVLQENFYSLSSKMIKTHHKKVNFFHQDKNNNKVIVIDVNSLCSSKYNNFISQILKVESKTLIIKTKEINKKVSYKEYFYSISDNIIVSFSILKNIYKNQYIGLKISSYIRIL